MGENNITTISRINDNNRVRKGKQENIIIIKFIVNIGIFAKLVNQKDIEGKYQK